jgi:tetratricopeptide (TPR) repeat protein
MIRTSRKTQLIAITGLLMLLLETSNMISHVWLNTGMLFLRNSVLESEGHEIGTYPFYAALEQSPNAPHAIRFLQRATTGDDSLTAAQWALGRASLGVGDVDSATKILIPLINQAIFNPLLYQDALSAFSMSGEFDAVVDLYEHAPLPEPTQAMSDTVALAYLEQRNQTESRLANIYCLRPDDLYANYHLWQIAVANGDGQAAATHSKTLIFFPLSAISPTDDRLLNYAVEVMPSLLEQELWDRPRLLNVISFLVWQHNDVPAVMYLLQRLIALYPAEPEWPFYLGELYQRRGDWQRAEQTYLQVLSVDSGYLQAYLRLGMVSEGKCRTQRVACKNLATAADWYRRYHELAPNDIMGLYKLVELYEVLGHAEAATLREELIAGTDDNRIVAELLGVPVETVELGENLVLNGDFEEWNDVTPQAWRLGTYLGQSRKEGLYVAGKDSLTEGVRAARILTLWGGGVPDGSTTYAEYIADAFLTEPKKYFISLRYASQYSDGAGLVYLGEYTQADGLVLIHSALPHTDAQWVYIHILTDTSSHSTIVIPLVRNWGVGQLWINALKIRPVICVEDLCP